eukprot:199142-Prymnesium_polylepis.1
MGTRAGPWPRGVNRDNGCNHVPSGELSPHATGTGTAPTGSNPPTHMWAELVWGVCDVCMKRNVKTTLRVTHPRLRHVGTTPESRSLSALLSPCRIPTREQ